MGLKQELGEIQYKINQLEARRLEIFKESRNAPKEDKVCLDSHAEMLSEIGGELTTYPISVTDIDYDEEGPVVEYPKDTGAFVAIRPCDPGYESKTYLGLYLGDVTIAPHVEFHKETGVLQISRGMNNPAIYIFDLKRIVFGMESWWNIIKTEADLKQITDKDIEDIWYVKALKAVTG